LSKTKLKELYLTLLKVRRAEERLLEIFASGDIPGFIHVSIGQEAIAAGVCGALTQTDTVFTTHRGHGHTIAKGMDLKKFMAEIYGRSDGSCKGRAGSMHVASKEAGVAGANGIVGAGMPISLGTAFASQYRGEDAVTVAFFGDGASNEGSFHESLNLASLWNLPVIFVCENNSWAQFTAQSSYMKLERISDRAGGYAMPGETVDGADIVAVYEAALKAVKRARSGQGPTLLECHTNRWFGHFAGDQQRYRDPADIESAREVDPLERFSSYLLENKVLDQKFIDQAEANLTAELDEAVAYAKASPKADPSDILADVYA
ncbi:MAG: thiamine pyrophosphate-dependent dehydrogenase E1 component subunit alpha, partial [Propionibacteriaceae bacterium]|nr:thiamine pyrophosphate-dependent dehydrogenase E1 component subunit alpha [Propionibacteriaceae bacterium]